MAYCSASDVAAFTPSVVASGSTFDSTTKPTDTAVNLWLSSGCGKLHAALNAAGYSTPVTQAGAPAVYDQLFQLNALYAAAFAEMGRSTTRLAPGQRTRGQIFMELFEDGLAQLIDGDLSRAGLTAAGTGKLYAGGISIDDKDLIEDDTDRVEPRFSRDMFKFPGRDDPEEQDRPTTED